MEGRTQIADVVIRLRESRGWTQRKLATVAGVTNANIADLERGRMSKPTAKFLEKLAFAFDVPLVSLLDAAGYQLGVPSIHHIASSGVAYASVPIIRSATVLQGALTKGGKRGGLPTYSS